MEVIGWTANMLFGLAALPQVYLCWKQKHANGVSLGLLSMWFAGEGLGLIYGIYKELPLPVNLNYILNLICITITDENRRIPRDA